MSQIQTTSRVLVFVWGLLGFICACGKVAEKNTPIETVRVTCSASRDAYCNVQWQAEPAARADNQVQVVFKQPERLTRESGSVRAYAQMQCCGSIREGVAKWISDDRLEISNLEMCLESGCW